MFVFIVTSAVFYVTSVPLTEAKTMEKLPWICTFGEHTDDVDDCGFTQDSSQAIQWQMRLSSNIGEPEVENNQDMEPTIGVILYINCI